MQAKDIVTERATVQVWTAYCPECAEGEIVPFLRAREVPNPAILQLGSGELADYRAAEAAVLAWRDSHASTVHGAALAAV